MMNPILRQILDETPQDLRQMMKTMKNTTVGKYIETLTEDGISVIISFTEPNEEELGLDYGTLDEICEVGFINGIKVYIVYI